jgi:hypothetical protein
MDLSIELLFATKKLPSNTLYSINTFSLLRIYHCLFLQVLQGLKLKDPAHSKMAIKVINYLTMQEFFVEFLCEKKCINGLLCVKVAPGDPKSIFSFGPR